MNATKSWKRGYTTAFNACSDQTHQSLSGWSQSTATTGSTQNRLLAFYKTSQSPKVNRGPIRCKIQGRKSPLRKFDVIIHKLEVMQTATTRLTVSRSSSIQTKIIQNSEKNLCKIERSMEGNKQKIPSLWIRQMQKILRPYSGPTNIYLSGAAKTQCGRTESLKLTNVSGETRVNCNQANHLTSGNPWPRQMSESTHKYSARKKQRILIALTG